jgi:hypothetical protein
VIIPSGYGQVNLQFTGDNLPTGAEVTFGILNSLSLSANDVGESVIIAIGSSEIMQEFVDDETIANVHVKLGPNASGPFADVGSEISGAVSTSGTSPNVAVLIKKSTTLGGRKGAGRMFWPGCPEGAIGSDGTIDSAARIAIDGAFAQFRTDLDVNDVPMVLLHNDSTSPNLVSSLTCDPIGATQRRRMRR